MKVPISLLVIGAACGIVGATNCTVISTTTVTAPFSTNEVGTGTTTGSFGFANGLTSVYENTTSVLSMTGALTNPFISRKTEEITIFTYTTVPVGTCIIGQPCSFLSAGPTTTLNATFIHSTIGNITQVSSASSVVSKNDTKGTIVATVSASTTLIVEENTTIAVTPAPADSTSIALVTISTASTSFTTVYLTESVTIEPAATTTTTATVLVPVETPVTAPSSATSLSVLTITVIPLPVKSTSTVSVNSYSTLSHIESNVEDKSLAAALQTIPTVPASSLLSIPTVTAVANSTVHSPVNTNSTTYPVLSTGNLTAVPQHTSSLPTTPAQTPSTLSAIHPTISPFLSTGRRLNVPLPFAWLSIFKLFQLSTAFHVTNTTVFPLVFNTTSVNLNASAPLTSHNKSIFSIHDNLSAQAYTATTTVVSYNATSLSTTSYNVYITITGATTETETHMPTTIVTTRPTISLVESAAWIGHDRPWGNWQMEEVTWLDLLMAGIYVVMMVTYLTVIDPLI